MKKVKNNDKILKGILFAAALYHLIIGAVGLFSSNFAVTVSKIAFNFNMILTDQIGWILKPFATYMLVFGILLVFAAKDPKNNKGIVYGFVIFTFVRALQKAYFSFLGDPSFFASHDIGVGIVNIAVLLVFGISTLLLYRKAYK